jgi:hypothetical protein
VGGRVEDEEAGVDRLGERRGRLEKQEALVAVVELEVGGSRGEVKGEARRGGVVVEWSEDGVVVGSLGVPDGRRGRDLRGVEEVAEEGKGAGQAACGDAAPAVAGEGGAEKAGEGEAAEDIAVVFLDEDGIPRYRILWLHRRWGWTEIRCLAMGEARMNS